MNAPDPMTCQQVFERLDDFLDRELDPAEVPRVEAHLATCAVCAQEYRFEGRVLSRLKDRLRRIAVPDSLKARVEAAIRRGRG